MNLDNSSIPAPSTGSPLLPAAGRLRLLRSRTGDPASAAAALASREWTIAARVLKSEAGSCVLSGRLNGLDVVVKCHRLVGIRAVLARVTGATRLLRQWHGGETLAASGFATPDLLLLFRGRDAGRGIVETLVCERAAGPTLLQVMAKRAGPIGTTSEHALADQAGRLVRDLHAAGLRNRDLKASNLIVTSSGLSQIDTVGIRRGRADNSGVAEMLMRLVVEPIGVGCPPRRSLRWRAARSALGEYPPKHQVRLLWRRVEALLQAHGDPTPKVNPLH